MVFWVSVLLGSAPIWGMIECYKRPIRHEFHDRDASSSENRDAQKSGLLKNARGMGVQQERRRNGRAQGDWHLSAKRFFSKKKGDWRVKGLKFQTGCGVYQDTL